MIYFNLYNFARCMPTSLVRKLTQRLDNFQGHRASEQNLQRVLPTTLLPPLPPHCTLHEWEVTCALFASVHPVFTHSIHIWRMNELSKIQIQIWTLASMLLPLHQLHLYGTCYYSGTQTPFSHVAVKLLPLLLLSSSSSACRSLTARDHMEKFKNKNTRWGQEAPFRKGIWHLLDFQCHCFHPTK